MLRMMHLLIMRRGRGDGGGEWRWRWSWELEETTSHAELHDFTLWGMGSDPCPEMLEPSLHRSLGIMVGTILNRPEKHSNLERTLEKTNTSPEDDSGTHDLGLEDELHEMQDVEAIPERKIRSEAGDSVLQTLDDGIHSLLRMGDGGGGGGGEIIPLPPHLPVSIIIIIMIIITIIISISFSAGMTVSRIDEDPQPLSLV